MESGLEDNPGITTPSRSPDDSHRGHPQIYDFAYEEYGEEVEIRPFGGQ